MITTTDIYLKTCTPATDDSVRTYLHINNHSGDLYINTVEVNDKFKLNSSNFYLMLSKETIDEFAPLLQKVANGELDVADLVGTKRKKVFISREGKGVLLKWILDTLSDHKESFVYLEDDDFQDFVANVTYFAREGELVDVCV